MPFQMLSKCPLSRAARTSAKDDTLAPGISTGGAAAPPAFSPSPLRSELQHDSNPARIAAIMTPLQASDRDDRRFAPPSNEGLQRFQLMLSMLPVPGPHALVAAEPAPYCTWPSTAFDDATPNGAAASSTTSWKYAADTSSGQATGTSSVPAP